MSRINTVDRQGRNVSFGLDHATGWFLQVFDWVADEETGEMEEVVVIDRDQMFSRFGKGQLLEALRDLLTPEEQARLRPQLTRIAMDLDPA